MAVKKVMLGFFCFLQSLAFAQETQSKAVHFDKEQVAAYNASASNLQEYVQRIIDCQFFAGAQQILDVGCGDGKITAFIAKKLSESFIVGCDISSSMIDFAKGHYGAPEYPNLAFVEKNARKMDYKNEFDRVISFNCLHWIDDQQQALDGIYSSLKPGGRAFLIACPKSLEDDLQMLCRKLVVSPKWARSFRDYKGTHSFHTPEEYKSMLLKSNFTIEKLRPFVREVVFEDRQSVETLFKAVLTPMHHLPEDQRSAFLNDVFQELEKKDCIEKNGKVHLHFAQIELLVAKN